MTDFIAELLEDVRNGGDEAQDAVLTLGLLLETRHPDEDAALVPIIGADRASRRLTPSESQSAIDGLVALLGDAPAPSSQVVGMLWALGKTQQASAGASAASAIGRFLDHPEGEPVIQQALQVLTVSLDATGLDIAAVRRALVAVAEHKPDHELSARAQALLAELDARSGTSDNRPS